jgi:hypothetical protein
MGMGGTGDGSYTDNRIYVSPKGFKPEQELNLICTYKVGGNKVEKNASWITGNLVSIKKSSYQYEGRSIPTLELMLMDDPDLDIFNNELPVRFIVEMSFGGAARELLNRMAYLCEKICVNENITKKVTLGVYTTKPNENSKVYKGLFLKYGDGVDIKVDEKCPANWQWDQLKGRVKDVRVNGQTMKDYSELDSFFTAVLENMVAPKVVGDMSSPTPAASAPASIPAPAPTQPSASAPASIPASIPATPAYRDDRMDQGPIDPTDDLPF